MINTSTGMIWDWSPFGYWEPMIKKQADISFPFAMNLP